MFLKALKKNIIIYLPTGLGKTFIALMLINEYAAELEANGKRTVFITNNVALARQQAEFFSKYTTFQVGEYFGDKIIDGKILDHWDAKIWAKELAENQVLVMTAQILVDLINHSFLGKIIFSALAKIFL